MPPAKVGGARARSGLDRRWAAPALGALGIVLGLLAWELAIVGGIVSELDVPHPAAVVAELGSLLGGGEFWTQLRQTMTNAGIGMAIATAIAVPLGMVMGTVQPIRVALGPVVEVLRPVPGIALVPLAIVVWGPTGGSTIFLVAFGCTWPLLVQTIHGVQSVDDVAIMTARSFRLSGLSRIRWVIFPGSLPYIATGLRICAAIALIVAVGGELIIGTPGLGTAIRQAQDGLALEEMYALIVVTGMLGIALNLAFGRLERRFLKWHPSQRGAHR
ncbi:MAG: ABC transporter permease [Solirubrobacteraceae bacterium]|nr:ABC transporter permease [Solirubrobacteraceae bacterium]